MDPVFIKDINVPPWLFPSPGADFESAARVFAEAVREKTELQGVSEAAAIAQCAALGNYLRQALPNEDDVLKMSVFLSEHMSREGVSEALTRPYGHTCGSALECVYAAIRNNMAIGGLTEKEKVSNAIGWGRAHVAGDIRNVDELREFLLALNAIELRWAPLSRNGLTRAARIWADMQAEMDELPATAPEHYIDRLAILIHCEEARFNGQRQLFLETHGYDFRDRKPAAA